MDYSTAVVLFVGAGLVGLAGMGLSYVVGVVTTRRKAGFAGSISVEIASLNEELSAVGAELKSVSQEVDAAGLRRDGLDAETRQLQALQARENELRVGVVELQKRMAEKRAELDALLAELRVRGNSLDELLAKLDLYGRVDEYVSVGHFDEPDYLHETSERFTAEIRRVRAEQKLMIKEGTAVELPVREDIAETKAATKRVLKGQARLILTAFNLECDLLIEKVRPSNLSRTLERIESIATKLEKHAASMHCGISPDYAGLKYQECSLQYQYRLKKAEEDAEQKQIREQMREEAKARREYEAKDKAAEKEERMYTRLLEQARLEASKATDTQREMFAARVEDLERQLAEAHEARQRAKAMAELTRRGHVYVISNLGSFGEDVYKIGLTRRLEPMDRVKELGDASVPFSFDVHAMIYVDDAPALEAALHRSFDRRRVNAVNRRKEFFRVTLDEIRKAAEELVGDELEFRTSIAAEEYFESRRLRAEAAIVAQA